MKYVYKKPRNNSQIWMIKEASFEFSNSDSVEVKIS